MTNDCPANIRNKSPFVKVPMDIYFLGKLSRNFLSFNLAIRRSDAITLIYFLFLLLFCEALFLPLLIQVVFQLLLQKK